MKSRFAWLAVAVTAFGAGAALWWSARPAAPIDPPTISGAALYATSVRDAQGRARPLGQFQGKLLVLNFWATWCAPCREEMPAFARLDRRWRDRGVAFVGLSDEPPEVIERFGRELDIPYPLWSAGESSAELSRRLGNRLQALPFTVLVAPSGRVVAAKVGPYTEGQLEALLRENAPKSP